LAIKILKNHEIKSAVKNFGFFCRLGWLIIII
jgi:hypothetical protein